MQLSITDIQMIVNSIVQETEINEDFKSLALSDVEKAIKLIIERDFPELLTNCK